MKKGFTLIELLIVIGILAVLSVAVVITLNPAELLRQARDSTRISDMATLKTALSLYFADVASPNIGNSASCYPSFGIAAGSGCSARFTWDDDGILLNPPGGTNNLLNAGNSTVTGSGWIPVNLAGISSGAPISSLPLDPTNNATLFYAFRPSGVAQAACTGASFNCLEYEINADMESSKFGLATSPGNVELDTKDGGNSPALYEVGTDSGLNL